MLQSRLFISKLLLCILVSEIQVEKISSCESSSQCHFNLLCCLETRKCQESCSGTNDSVHTGLIIASVAAILLGIALFWTTFCCLCWNRCSRRSLLHYQSFTENEGNSYSQASEDDIRCDGAINNQEWIHQINNHQDDNYSTVNQTETIGRLVRLDTNNVNNSDNKSDDICLSIIRKERWCAWLWFT